jgi:hypothetical protein
MLVDALAREKNVDRETVFVALELALASATKKAWQSKQKFAEDADVQVQIDRDEGTYRAFRRWEVVEDDLFELPDVQYLLREAQEIDPSKQIGDFVEEPMEAEDFGRIGAQAAHDGRGERTHRLGQLVETSIKARPRTRAVGGESTGKRRAEPMWMIPRVGQGVECHEGSIIRNGARPS